MFYLLSLITFTSISLADDYSDNTALTEHGALLTKYRDEYGCVEKKINDVGSISQTFDSCKKNVSIKSAHVSYASSFGSQNNNFLKFRASASEISKTNDVNKKSVSFFRAKNKQQKNVHITTDFQGGLNKGVSIIIKSDAQSNGKVHTLRCTGETPFDITQQDFENPKSKLYPHYEHCTHNGVAKKVNDCEASRLLANVLSGLMSIEKAFQETNITTCSSVTKPLDGELNLQDEAIAEPVAQ